MSNVAFLISYCTDVTTAAHVATPYELYPHSAIIPSPPSSQFMAAATSFSSHAFQIAQRSPNFCVYDIYYSHTGVLKAWHLARNHHHPKVSCVIVGIQIRLNGATFRVPITRGESRTSEYLPVFNIFHPSFPSRIPKLSWQPHNAKPKVR